MKLNPILVRLALVCAVTICVTDASAQLPGAKLTALFPPSGQAGTPLEISIDGSDLNGVERLEFSHPGISGVPVMAGGDEFIQRQQWQGNRFTVNIAADVPPGIYESWFVGRYGISNSRPFVVGDLPEPVEVGGNNSHETALPIALNSVLVGRADVGMPDCFRIDLKAGQQVVFDCQAQRIGSRLDAALKLSDATGRVLATGRDGRDGDPVIVFKAPADGGYLVAISDFLSAGGSDRVYRLTVSDRPWIEAIFPPAAVPGTRSKFTLHGANFPGGADTMEVEIELPEQPAQIGDGFWLRPREMARAGMNYRFHNSNPARVAFASAPVVIEEPTATVQKVVVPSEIAGHLSPVGESDAFEFDAKKGEAIVIEAISHRAGHATDLYFTVERIVVDAEGKRSETQVAEAEDDASNPGGNRARTDSRDPVLMFTAPEDGSYVVRLVDQFRLDDPSVAYRLAIRRPAPDFSLMAELVDPRVDGNRLENWSPVLLRGGRLQIWVAALRGDGFDGEIELGLEGAPAGVLVVAGKIAKGQSSAVITIEGGAEMPSGIGALRVVGKSGELVRPAHGISLLHEVGDFNNEQVNSRLQEKVLLSSSERGAPIALQIEVPEVIETSIGATVEIPLKIAKHGEFKGPAKFLVDGIPNVQQRAEVDLDLNQVVEGKLALALKPTNENKYAAGEFEIHVRCDAVLNYPPDPQSVVEATEDQKVVESMVVQAAEALKQVEARKVQVVAQVGLTDEEKAGQTAAADAEIAEAQNRVTAVDAAKKRADELLNQANARNKPRDLRVVGYSQPVTLKISSAPLRFKDVPDLVEVAKGASVDVSVGVERLFGFAEALELSLVAPKDVPGFVLAPVGVAKDALAGKLVLQVGADAAEGEHAFVVLGKVNFNGVACELSQPLKVKVVGAPAPPEESSPAGAPTP